MMRLLRSWRDSLLLLAPQNFKLFALVTLKSTFETYKVIARVLWYFWVLPLAVLFQQLYWGREAFVAQFTATLSVPYYIMTGVLYLWSAVWMIVSFCLATRPSIGQKNRLYFENYGRFTMKLALVAIVLWQVVFWWKHFFASFHYELTTALILGTVLEFFVLVGFLPLYIFFILFYLDSDGSVKELWTAAVRAIKMTVYNFPLLLALMIAIALPAFLVIKYATSHQWAMGYILPLFFLLVLKPLLINLWTNIYIKKLHEMPDLYFNQPK